MERISDDENEGDLFQEKDIKVSVEGVMEDEDGRFCRAWTEVLGLPDGGFMVRYRFHQPCQQVFCFFRGESILKKHHYSR